MLIRYPAIGTKRRLGRPREQPTKGAPMFLTCSPATRCFAAMMTVGLLAASALAVVTQRSVTPASAKAKDSRVSVEANRDKDGMIQFTITYRLPRPQHLVAHFEVRDGETVLAKTDTPGFVHEDSAAYHLAIPAKY